MYLSKYTAVCIQDLVFSLKTVVYILRFYAQFFIGFETCCVHPLQTFLNMCIIFSVLDIGNLILGSNISYPGYKAFATLE